MLKLFVAAKWEERKYARTVMDQLEAAGHSVTHDWTKEDPGERKGRELDAYMAQCALDDLHGVEEAQCLIILSHPNGKGMFVEQGIAIARKIPVMVVDRAVSDHVYHYMPDHWHLDRVDELFEALKDLEDEIATDGTVDIFETGT